MASTPAFLMPALSTHKESDFGGVLTISENLWPEQPNEMTQYPYRLMNPPGVIELTQIIADPPGQAVTGLFQQSGIFDGDLFIFYSNRLSRVSALSPSTGNIDNASVIAKTDILPISAGAYTKSAAIRGYLSWVDATGTAWSYDGATGIPVVDLPASIGDVCSLAKRFVWIDTFTDQAYYSNLGLATFNPVNFFTAETISDKLNCCFAHSNRLYLAGDLVTEIYVPSNDFELPFSYTGVTLPIGSKSPGSWASTQNFIGMIESTSESLGVYQVSGGTYQKISPPWLDRRLNLLSEDLRREITATAYTIEGHPTYELHIPGSAPSLTPLSLGYDIAFESWYEITDPAVANGFARRWVSQLNTTPVCGRAAGQIGAFSRMTPNYFGQAQRRRWAYWQGTDRTSEQTDFVVQMQFTSPPVAAGIKGIVVPKADINAAGGVRYSVSDNMGVDFSVQKQITINYHRKFGHFCSIRRGGELNQPGRVHQLECSGNFNVEVGPSFVNSEVLFS